MHKEVQRKAFEQVKIFFESSDESFLTFSDISKLNFIEMIVKETMRLFPPGSMLGRLTTGKVELGLTTKMKQNFVKF